MIKLAENTIDKKDYKTLINFLQKKSYLNQSKVTESFEKKFSKKISTKYSVFVNSGSSANLLIAQALLEGNFLKNKTVILPAVSWSTSVAPFIQLGYRVILCDCDKYSLGLDQNHLRKLCLKYKPSLVVVVNVLGHSNNFKSILNLKKRFKFELIEDNCESLGSRFKKKNLGTIGLASSHSFYFGHHISTIEGGMVSTKNREFYNVCLAIRSHGWARDVEKKYKKQLEKKYKIDEFKSLFTFYYSGFNIRSTDFNARLGIEQLKLIGKVSKIRHHNFLYYKKKLSNFWFQDSGLELISSMGYATFVKNRFEVFKYLRSKKIQSRPLICGNMAQQPFLKNTKILKTKLNNANFVDKYGIYIPNHANLSLKDLKYVVTHFNSIAEPKHF
jgi:CDP-4-dehydro-6-deoxyglucose reductase, E1